MSDLWDGVRHDVIRRLNHAVPTMPFEMRVIIAEDVAREVESYATPGPDGRWLLDPKTP